MIQGRELTGQITCIKITMIWHANFMNEPLKTLIDGERKRSTMKHNF